MALLINTFAGDKNAYYPKHTTPSRYKADRFH